MLTAQIVVRRPFAAATSRKHVLAKATARLVGNGHQRPNGHSSLARVLRTSAAVIRIAVAGRLSIPFVIPRPHPKKEA